MLYASNADNNDKNDDGLASSSIVPNRCASSHSCTPVHSKTLAPVPLKRRLAAIEVQTAAAAAALTAYQLHGVGHTLRNIEV